MRILVLGAGGVGGYFGGRLAESKADVSFLVRPARAKRLSETGLVVKSPCGDALIQVPFISEASSAYDVVVLTCKAYDLDSAIDAIAPAVGPRTAIVPLLNGLRHYDMLDKRFGAARVLAGLCNIGATLNEQGEVLHLNKLERLVLGPRTHTQVERARELREVFARGKYQFLYSEEVMQEAWEKFAFIAAFAGLTTLFRATIGAIVSAAEGEAIAKEFIAECSAVAAANGRQIRAPAMDSMVEQMTERGSKGSASMMRDMLRGLRTEHEHIFGDMIARGHSAGVKTPLLRLSLANMQAYASSREAST